MKRLLVVVLFMVGCAGSISYRDGEREIELEQPSDPDGAAELSVAPDGTIRVSVPKARAQESYTEKATVNGLMVLGGVFALAAVASFVLKAKFPLMPSNLPVGLAVASAVCFTLPSVIKEHLDKILVAAGLWAGWIVYSYKHNKKLKSEDPGES